MNRRLYYDCNFCGTASTDETQYRGIAIDPDDPKQRMITEAFANEKHICLECIRFLSEYQLRSDVDNRRI